MMRYLDVVCLKSVFVLHVLNSFLSEEEIRDTILFHEEFRESVDEIGIQDSICVCAFAKLGFIPLMILIIILILYLYQFLNT